MTDLRQFGLLDANGHAVASDERRRAALPSDLGANVPNSVADVHVLFPADWLALLREHNPVSEAHSWLLPYWYRARERWVLYDCVPRALIDEDAPQMPGLMGYELLALLEGPPPRETPDWARVPFVSDAQHEMYRLYRVYARPFWVLEGETGGHQVRYSPEQKNFLTQIGRQSEPPAIGELEPCPFDMRVVRQLQRIDRLKQLRGSIDRLRKSGSGDAADAQRDAMEREIRVLSMAMMEQQLAGVADMVATLGKRTEASDSVIHATGQAAKAKDAIAAYIETGNYIL